DLRLVDLESGVLGGGEAWGLADGAVDVEQSATPPADQVVVVVADAILVARRRAGRLDAAQQTLLGKDGDGVVHGPARDRADLAADDLDHLVGGDVRAGRDRP